MKARKYNTSRALISPTPAKQLSPIVMFRALKKAIKTNQTHCFSSMFVCLDALRIIVRVYMLAQFVVQYAKQNLLPFCCLPALRLLASSPPACKCSREKKARPTRMPKQTCEACFPSPRTKRVMVPTTRLVKCAQFFIFILVPFHQSKYQTTCFSLPQSRNPAMPLARAAYPKFGEQDQERKISVGKRGGHDPLSWVAVLPSSRLAIAGGAAMWENAKPRAAHFLSTFATL